MITLQQIFDRVVTHLLTQKKPARDGSRCLYLTADGLKCAVGCLIDEKHYSFRILEGERVSSPQVQAAVAKSLGVAELDHEMISLLSDLQVIHDTNYASAWRNELQFLAKCKGLTFNPPTS